MHVPFREIVSIAFGVALMAGILPSPAGAVDGPPVLKQIPKTMTINGDTRTDNYYWLNQKQNPDVSAYLNAENAWTAKAMAATEPLQKHLYDEMLAHIKQTDLSVPYRRGGYFYYTKTAEGKQYGTLVRRKGSMDAPEEVLLDLNELAVGKTFLGLGSFAVSDDGNLLAYSLDSTGYRQYTLHVKDLRSGQTLAEAIPRVDAVVWAKDNRTLFYSTEDDVSKRSDTVWRHVVGAGASEQVYHESDEIYDTGVGRTRDGEYILIGSEAKDTTEYRYLPAASPTASPVVFAPRKDGIRYDVDEREGLFYVRTNEAAPDFRVFTTPVATPGRDHWTELVAQRPGVTITDVSLFKNFGVISGRRNGLASLELLNIQTKALTPLTFDETDYVVGLGQNFEYDTPTLRFNYQSLVTPSSVFDLDIASGKRTLLKRTDVPGYDPSLYASERAFMTARDGTKIPVSIVARKDVKHDGSAPLLLYGYGSYGISIDPTFSPSRLALLDRGVIYAIAHIRGGGEFGESWRLAGNLNHKVTTFTDFIDCADGLIAAKYTAKDRLVIQGGSAGGLLMGAVTNMRPDLFHAVIAQVPFVDVLTTMLDPSLPLTTGEYREWGNPNDPTAYAYMKTYSPVDNVTAKPYPTVLVEVSFNDSQVPYWEGTKLAAKMRLATTSGKPILLKANMGAGHGGASGRYDALKETAFNWAFVLSQVGIAQ